MARISRRVASRASRTMNTLFGGDLPRQDRGNTTRRIECAARFGGRAIRSSRLIKIDFIHCDRLQSTEWCPRTTTGNISTFAFIGAEKRFLRRRTGTAKAVRTLTLASIPPRCTLRIVKEYPVMYPSIRNHFAISAKQLFFQLIINCSYHEQRQFYYVCKRCL